MRRLLRHIGLYKTQYDYKHMKLRLKDADTGKVSELDIEDAQSILTAVYGASTKLENLSPPLAQAQSKLHPQVISKMQWFLNKRTRAK